jgi:hypothetical protein
MSMKKSISPILLSGLLGCFLTSSVLAQSSGPPNDLDNNYVPAKSSILGKSVDSKYSKGVQAREDAAFHNAIEFNPGILVRNIFAMQYEHKFNDVLAVHGGLGYVFGRDGLQNTLFSEGPIFGNATGNQSSINLSDILNYAKFTGPDVYFSLALRVYFERTHIDNYYNSYNYNSGVLSYLELGYRNFGNTFLLSNSTQSALVVDKDSKIGISNSIFYFTYGIHLQTSGHIISTHHFYSGFGIRSTTYDGFKQTAYTGYNGNYVNSLSGIRYNTLNPTFLIGYELGFAITK